MIEVNILSKNYGGNIVLQNIHLRFETGRVYGVVGENGAGKTTLFRCIAGLETYSGHVTSQYQPLKNHLGFLLTEPFFFEKMTGEEYLRLLCDSRKKPIPDLKSKNIFDLPLDQYASLYSTGMKKKLAITGILLQENDYFILDEPFNGVDIQSNILLTEIILKLKALGKVVIIASHIFSTLSDTCDEIHLLGNGALLKTAKKEEFNALEQEMKITIIQNRIEQMDLK